MSDLTNQITITIPASEAAQQHIISLQATLTKRNLEIERLTKRYEDALTGEPNQQALATAYRHGWQAAANHLMSTTHTAAQALGKVRKDAFEIYLKAGAE